jgi:hypothetical protein
MKYTISNTFFLLIITCPSFIQTKKPIKPWYTFTQKKPSSERAENAKFVLANIAQMIGQIGTIVEEPRNPDNVGNAVTNIVNNIVKITVHAVNNKHIDIEEAQNIMNILEKVCLGLDDDLLAMINVRKLHLLHS